MIISKALQYVYIGIPRTGSKSMNTWLMDNYQGEWFGNHHDWRVPDFAKDYLIFTIVRNPYDRAVSGYFGLPWNDSAPHEALREHVPMPAKSSNPLTTIIAEAMVRTAAMPEAEGDMNQAPFVRKAHVSLVLYFERLPYALKELPFVYENAMAPFPHMLERGIRPSGDFFDLFSTDDEAHYWAYAREDFDAFGYQRYSSELPAEAPNAIRMR